MKIKLGKKVDFKKFVLHNGYTLIEKFESSIELQEYLIKAMDLMRVPSSQFENCTIENCLEASLHKMRQQYCICKCSKKCELKFKIKSCMISKRIDLFRSHAESCVRGDQDGKSRGILNYIKSLIIDMIEYDSDITPKRVLNQLTIKRKKDESEGKSVCLLNHLPSLKQVYMYRIIS